jgi:hypothetical protein
LDIQAFKFSVIGGHTEQMVDKGRRLGGIDHGTEFIFCVFVTNLVFACVPLEPAGL